MHSAKDISASSTRAEIESTYKDQDTEEFIDIYFFRPCGYLLALAARRLKVTPNAITIVGMILGVISGHLFYYSSLSVNIIGIFVKIVSNALDSADGQLARMTRTESNMGRILDGISSHVIFTSIYLHLCLRYIYEGNSPWIFAVAAVAGVCHYFQAGWGDYYRNGYLYFVRGPDADETKTLEQLREEYKTLKWKDNFIYKFIVHSERNYMSSLQIFTKCFRALKVMVEEAFGKDIPAWLSHEYRQMMKPMNKYYNGLTINSRQFSLFVFLLLQRPELFFVFELVVLSVVFVHGIVIQEKKIKHLIALTQLKITDASINEGDKNHP
jgi:phosphatidylserine synthase